MSSKYIEMTFRVPVEPDKVDGVLWYLGEHLHNFTDITGPAEWCDNPPEIVGYTVDGNEWESPKYDV